MVRSVRPSIDLPPDAADALARVAGARAAFDRLAPTHRREYVEAIVEAKRPETRARRIARMVDQLASGGPSHPTVSTRPAVAKMGISGGERVLVLDADDAALAIWAALPPGVTLVRRAGGPPCDVVVLYALTAAALARRLPVALRACGSAGTLWVAYPKKTSGRASTLTRDAGWDATQRPDLRPIAMIALDDVWAGVKFRLLPT